MPLKVELLGMDKLQALMRRAGPQSVKVLGQALTEEAQLAFRESQQLVPRRTGVLAASGQIQPPQFDGERVTVTLGYGGAASSYALIVHENPNAQHQGGRQWKYLEVPVLRRVPKLTDNLVRRMERIVKESS
jgi:hypothetical protein